MSWKSSEMLDDVDATYFFETDEAEFQQKMTEFLHTSMAYSAEMLKEKAATNWAISGWRFNDGGHVRHHLRRCRGLLVRTDHGRGLENSFLEPKKNVSLVSKKFHFFCFLFFVWKREWRQGRRSSRTCRTYTGLAYCRFKHVQTHDFQILGVSDNSVSLCQASSLFVVVVVVFHMCSSRCVCERNERDSPPQGCSQRGLCGQKNEVYIM